MADYNAARVIFSDALKRYLNNPGAWSNPDLREWIFESIIDDLAQSYVKRLENSDHNSATSYSTDGYSAVVDTSNIFAPYAPILYPYRKPRTVTQNDSTDWKTEITV